MKRFSLKILVAALYLFSTLAHAFANDILDPKVAEQMLRRMGPGSSIETYKHEQDGVITHTMRVRNCSGDGLICRSSYRTTRTLVSVENKRLVVETVDRRDFQQNSVEFSRLNFKVAPMPVAKPQPGKDGGPVLPPVNPEHFLHLDLTPESNFAKEMKVVAPSLISGLYNGFQDMQASAQLAAQMQVAYSKTMEAYGRASDHLVDHASRSSEISREASEQFQVLAASTMTVPVHSVNATADYRDYVQTSLDPFTFKEFELTEASKAQFKQSLKEALAKKDAAQVVELGKTLLQQMDPQARESAERELSPVFKDGIVRSQALGAKAPSLVDETKYGTYRHSASGQIIRQIANKAQVEWIASHGLAKLNTGKSAAYTSALVALKAADTSFTKGRSQEGLYLSEVANTLLDFSNGFVTGGIAGVSEAVQAIPVVASALSDFTQLLVTDPNAAVEKFGGFVASIPGVAEAVAVHYLTLADQLKSGTAAERGKALGQLSSEVVLLLVTDGAAAAAARGGKAIVSAAVRGSKAGQIAAGLGKAVVTPGIELGKQLSGQAAKVVLEVAKTDRALAVNVIKASRAIEGAGVSVAKEYLDFVGTQSTKLGEQVKSTVAVTDAVEAGVITNTEQLTKAKRFVDALDGAPHQLDLRQVGASDKIAIIGRSMDDNVGPIANHLEKHGLAVEKFKLSESAYKNWQTLKAQYPNGVPIEVQRISPGYIENKNWVQKLVDEGYTVVDANNPKSLGDSIYYELERSMFPKGKR